MIGRIAQAATRGAWNEVWDSFDRRQSAKLPVAANEGQNMGLLLAGVAAE